MSVDAVLEMIEAVGGVAPISAECDYTLLKPNRRLNQSLVMSGHLVRCPCCGKVAMIKRNVQRNRYIHVGLVKRVSDEVKIISASQYCTEELS